MESAQRRIDSLAAYNSLPLFPPRNNVRINLKVPFAEKDAAKKLGARWDATRKVWYVIGKDDLGPFAKWSPMIHDESSIAPTPSKSVPARTQATGKVYVGSDYVEHTLVCDCLPWDDCDKCRATARLPS